jgi:hypothetical protein
MPDVSALTSSFHIIHFFCAPRASSSLTGTEAEKPGLGYADDLYMCTFEAGRWLRDTTCAAELLAAHAAVETKLASLPKEARCPVAVAPPSFCSAQCCDQEGIRSATQRAWLGEANSANANTKDARTAHVLRTPISISRPRPYENIRSSDSPPPGVFLEA